MKKNLLNLLINLVLTNIFIFIFLYSNNIKNSVIVAINIWKNILIPNIFPFLLISSLMVKYGLINIISKTIGPLIKKIYNLPQSSSYAILTSIITGFPTGSIYIKDLLNNKEIDIDDANSLIAFTSYSNPIFVISGIGETLLNNKKIGIKIYIVHLTTGLIMGLFFRNKNKKSKDTKYKIIVDNKSFINNLTDSINNTFKVLINILGIIIFFYMIVTIINIIFPNNIYTSIIKGILELTTGVSNISSLKIAKKLKIALIGFLISFNGLSVHFQTKSIIEKTGIKYKNYFISRIIQSLLCFIILYIF